MTPQQLADALIDMYELADSKEIDITELDSIVDEYVDADAKEDCFEQIAKLTQEKADELFTELEDEGLIPTEITSTEITFDDLKGMANIKEDGIAVLNLYMEKYFPTVTGKDDVKLALEDFESDVGDYALPAVRKMLDCK